MNGFFMNGFFLAATLALSVPALHAQTALPPAPPAQAAPPAAPSASPAVTLRYKFAVGQVHRYQYDAAMNMLMDTGQTEAGVPITMTMQIVVRQTVKSIRPADGAATLSTQIESLHLLRGGQEMPLPDAQMTKIKQPFTQVMLPTGKILSIDMPALGGAGGPGMNIGKGLMSDFLSAAALPEGPVKVGDTWNGTSTPAAAGIDGASTSTLAGVDQKNGATVATIHNKQAGTINSPMTEAVPGGMKMSGQKAGASDQVFDVTTGTLQAAQGASTTDMLMTLGQASGATQPGMPSAMKMQLQTKFQVQRLSDTAPVAPPAQ